MGLPLPAGRSACAGGRPEEPRPPSTRKSWDRRWALTPTESRVAVMMAAGHTVRATAVLTARSENTIRWHVRQIFRKLGISRQSELVRRVLALASLPQPRR